MVSNVSGCLSNILLRKSNEFMYTWVIENYKSAYYGTGIKVGSPLITLYTRGDRYEFQIKIDRYSAQNYYYTRAEIQTLLCPDDQTNALVKLSFLKNDGAEYVVKESTCSISKGDTCCSLSANIVNNQFIDSCVSNGNLSVKVKITFNHDISHGPDNAAQGATIALCKTSILNDYEELLNSAEFSDVTLVVGDKKFPAHKAILASRSPVFSAMFKHDMLENKENIVEITDVEPEIMAEVLRFIYADKVNNLKGLVADLLVAADKYQLEDLRLMCEEILIMKLNIENFEEILKIADRYASCRRLRDSVAKFFIANGKEIASLQNFEKIFQALSPALLTEMIKSFMMIDFKGLIDI